MRDVVAFDVEDLREPVPYAKLVNLLGYWKLDANPLLLSGTPEANCFLDSFSDTYCNGQFTAMFLRHIGIGFGLLQIEEAAPFLAS